MEFQKKMWRVQRIGWVIMLIVLLLGLVGLFGLGPLSNARAGDDAAPLQIEYERFVRVESAAQVRFELAPGVAPSGIARLQLDRAYADKMRVEQVVPEPESTEADGEYIFYSFNLADPALPALIVLHVEPQSAGTVSGQMGLADGQTYEVNQFIYP